MENSAALTKINDFEHIIFDFDGTLTHHTHAAKQKTILRALDKIGLANHFQKIVSWEDVMFIKPDPEGLNLII